MVAALARDQGEHSLIVDWLATRRLSGLRTRVLLAVTPPLLRDLLRTLISDEPDLVVVEEAPDRDLLTATGRTRADVVLLDWPPSGGLSEFGSRLLTADPGVLIIAIRTDGLGQFAVYRFGVTQMRGAASLASVLAAIRDIQGSRPSGRFLPDCIPVGFPFSSFLFSPGRSLS